MKAYVQYEKVVPNWEVWVCEEVGKAYLVS